MDAVTWMFSLLLRLVVVLLFRLTMFGDADMLVAPCVRVKV